MHVSMSSSNLKKPFFFSKKSILAKTFLIFCKYLKTLLFCLPRATLHQVLWKNNFFLEFQRFAIQSSFIAIPNKFFKSIGPMLG